MALIEVTVPHLANPFELHIRETGSICPYEVTATIRARTQLQAAGDDAATDGSREVAGNESMLKAQFVEFYGNPAEVPVLQRLLDELAARQNGLQAPKLN